MPNKLGPTLMTLKVTNVKISMTHIITTSNKVKQQMIILDKKINILDRMELIIKVLHTVRQVMGSTSMKQIIAQSGNL
jgi:hypothetical protein